MKINRRDFLKTSVIATSLVVLPPLEAQALPREVTFIYKYSGCLIVDYLRRTWKNWEKMNTPTENFPKIVRVELSLKSYASFREAFRGRGGREMEFNTRRKQINAGYLGKLWNVEVRVNSTIPENQLNLIAKY